MGVRVSEIRRNRPFPEEIQTPLVRDRCETGTRHVIATYEPRAGSGRYNRQSLWTLGGVGCARMARPEGLRRFASTPHPHRSTAEKPRQTVTPAVASLRRPAMGVLPNPVVGRACCPQRAGDGSRSGGSAGCTAPSSWQTSAFPVLQPVPCRGTAPAILILPAVRGLVSTL
jgi:hypothetical protein